jgi:hypothetical protein
MHCSTGNQDTYMQWATEWKILERLHGHPNVVALHHMFFTPLSCVDAATFVLVIDLCDRDLSRWIRHYAVVEVQALRCGHMHDRYVVLLCGCKQFGFGGVKPSTAVCLNRS